MIGGSTSIKTEETAACFFPFFLFYIVILLGAVYNESIDVKRAWANQMIVIIHYDNGNIKSVGKAMPILIV